MNSFVSSRGQVFSLVFLLFSCVPAIGQLNFILMLALSVPVALHNQLQKKPLLRWSILLVILCLALYLVHISEAGWLSAESVLSVLVTVLVLKWSESNSSREYLIVTLACTLVAALSSLYLPSLPAMAYLLTIGVMLINGLILINDSDKLLSFIQVVRRSIGISLVILPVTVVLFITMPRVQGPLWDLGLAIGLPIELAIDQNAKDIGLKGSLKAGQVSRLKQSDAPVLVAEFSGSVPYKSRMYWRGPVFSDYDGVTWNLPEHWDKRSNLLKGSYRGVDAVDKVLTSKRDKVHYEARVSPHSSHWLYSLDMPSGQTPEALISKDFQLLGIRKISWEFKYDIYAWLEYTGGRQPSEAEMAAYLNYPQNSNPRLQAFGKDLQRRFPMPQDRIDALYTHLASQGFKMSLTSEIEESLTSLDQYFFDHKQGTIEHLASSTAMVLRAAGIPSRLIAGYRGGSLIALTDFVVVKQEHAHVWVESWIDGIGWQRIEAKDLVVPPEKNRATTSAAIKKQAAKATDKKSQAQPVDLEQPKVVEKQKSNKQSEKKNTDSSSQWAWLKKLSSGVETWVLNYNPDRQVELLKKSGLRKVDWKNLLAISFLSLLLLALLYSLFLNIKKSKTDPVELAFTRLNNAFVKMQLGCDVGECPSQWLLRIKQAQPDIYPALKQVIDQYLAVRYGDQNTPEGKSEFIRDVKRLVAMI